MHRKENSANNNGVRTLYGNDGINLPKKGRHDQETII